MPKSEKKSSNKKSATTRKKAATGAASTSSGGRTGTGSNPDVPGEGAAVESPPPATAVTSPISSLDSSSARFTVVYIHGIGNKVAAPDLKIRWDIALFDLDMGDRTRMAYWADIRYGSPLSETQSGPSPASVPESFRPTSDVELTQETVDLVPVEAQDFAADLTAKLLVEAAKTEPQLLQEMTGDVAALSVEATVLPNPLRGWFTERILKNLVPDTAAYFFNVVERDEIQNRLRSILVPGRNPYIVIAHSMGTVIAYDILHELDPATVRVPLFLTLGSPLGIEEVKDHLTRTNPWKVPECVEEWVNGYDEFDIVALRQNLKSEYDPNTAGVAVRDLHLRNPERRSDPHSISGYLNLDAVRQEIYKITGREFVNPVGDFVLARDLAASMAGDTVQRHPVLIEKSEVENGLDPALEHSRLVNDLKEITGHHAAANIDELRHYVAANLTAPELEQLTARHGDLRFETIWKNTEKTALLTTSIHTVQASTAQDSYRASGRGIAWAVLDTGVQETHPHFVNGTKPNTIATMWDCTALGPPAAGMDAAGNPIPNPATTLPYGRDVNGHGTHVAGIIAGSYHDVRAAPDAPEQNWRGMAPAARLHCYKVLDDQGHGSDSYIIKALDHIAVLNDSAANLVIHGINLSLGGSFDPKVFQCGFSPICREVRRLCRQGVVVCIAAGNEGRIELRDAQSQRRSLSFDLSIGDPANLEEAIAVGSVHKESPQLYGISYFSSRGPTADGRPKPDLVAPGGEIFSCNVRFNIDPTRLYVPMSGTSMACPHVSGLIAAFLSVRREYIGYPEKVKEILLANCTDLRRDLYHQGAGLPNLMKMLANTC